MTSETIREPHRPIFARAADNGLIISIYITLLVIATGLSTAIGVASLFVWAGSLAMPFFVYRMLRRSSREAGGELSFPELWAEGIASFFLGTLLPAALTYICLRFITPDYILNTVTFAISYLSEQPTPEASLWAETLNKIVANNGLPTPTDIAAQLISFNIIAGTVLSFFGALAVVLTRSKS